MCESSAVDLNMLLCKAYSLPPVTMQALFDLVCTPEGQALKTAQMLVFQPPQALSKAGGRKQSLSSTDRDMSPLVVGAMHDATAIQLRVVGARALGQLAAALQSHAGAAGLAIHV